MGFGFFGANNNAGGEEFGAKHSGEAFALSVFAGHWQTKNIDRAGAKPLFDCRNLSIHSIIITYYTGSLDI